METVYIYILFIDFGYFIFKYILVWVSTSMDAFRKNMRK